MTHKLSKRLQLVTALCVSISACAPALAQQGQPDWQQQPQQQGSWNQPTTETQPQQVQGQWSGQQQPQEWRPQQSWQQQPQAFAPRPSWQQQPQEWPPRPSWQQQPQAYAPRPSWQQQPQAYAPRPSWQQQPQAYPEQPSWQQQPQAYPEQQRQGYEQTTVQPRWGQPLAATLEQEQGIRNPEPARTMPAGYPAEYQEAPTNVSYEQNTNAGGMPNNAGRPIGSTLGPRPDMATAMMAERLMSRVTGVPMGLYSGGNPLGNIVNGLTRPPISPLDGPGSALGGMMGGGIMGGGMRGGGPNMNILRNFGL